MASGTQHGAENITWDLSDLYSNPALAEKDLADCEAEADRFAASYYGRVATLADEALAGALREFEHLHDKVGRVQAFAYLRWSGDTNRPEYGALLQKVREGSSSLTQKLLFFELEWMALDDARAKELLASPALSRYRHYLEIQRLLKPHVLTEPEEKILAEKSVTGVSAWGRYFDQLLGATRFQYRGQSLTEQEILSKLHEPDREVRREAALVLSEGLGGRLPELAFIFNTMLAEKASDDRLRRYPNWLAARNQANEISDATVEALVSAVTSRYDLVARYYRLKARLLGIDQLEDYDRYAPLPGASGTYSWDTARETVLTAYGKFDPELGSIAERFFHGWIDAAVRPGKRGGAFSHGVVPSAHPYILVNYTGKLRDVQTLAHELGHGVHQYLSREQGVLQASTPLTMAETASVFGEMLVFQSLMEQETRRENRLSMLAGKIDDTIATVFRQVAMNRFEDAIHNARRTEGELSVDRFSALWLTSQQAMFESSVKLNDYYSAWWSYIPHFIHTPGYVYAYAFGELLVLSLHRLYGREGEQFVRKYVELLRAGGSDWPETLLKAFGVDLREAGFWAEGLNSIDDLITQAEDLSK